jgi:large subunit ribosomal protein L13Ae
MGQLAALFISVTYGGFCICSRFIVTRNKVKYAQFIKKRMNTNPGRGPFHFRSPARIFWRTVSSYEYGDYVHTANVVFLLCTAPWYDPPQDRERPACAWQTCGKGVLSELLTLGAYCCGESVFQAFEGIPEPYDKKKRVVVPSALKTLRLRADRNFTVLGELSKEVGWGYTDLVAKLEAQRKIKEQAYYAEKKAQVALKSKAAASADLSAVSGVLAPLGY